MKYFIEQLNVNDDEYFVVNVHVEDGQWVHAGDALIDLETSKATVEIEAELEGFVSLHVSAGQNLAVGQHWCTIQEKEMSTATAEEQENDLALARRHANVPSVAQFGGDFVRSDAAQGQGPDAQDGGKGFVTARESKTPRSSHRPVLRNVSPAPPDGAIPALPYEAMSRDARKKMEIDNLLTGNGDSLSSAICFYFDTGTRPYSVTGIFANNISDILIYEVAALLPTFPLVNAFHLDDDTIGLYSNVNIGYSVDIEDDLTVYSICDADRLAQSDIRDRINEILENHLTGKISRKFTKPTTLTLTDLSAYRIGHFIPLINGQQSCILGHAAPDDGRHLLSCTFDHRILNGRYVSEFMTALVNRVCMHFQPDAAISAECFYCGKPAAEAAAYREKGFLQVRNSSGDIVDCCRVCFEGW